MEECILPCNMNRQDALCYSLLESFLHIVHIETQDILLRLCVCLFGKSRDNNNNNPLFQLQLVIRNNSITKRVVLLVIQQITARTFIDKSFPKESIITEVSKWTNQKSRFNDGRKRNTNEARVTPYGSKMAFTFQNVYPGRESLARCSKLKTSASLWRSKQQ